MNAVDISFFVNSKHVRSISVDISTIPRVGENLSVVFAQSGNFDSGGCKELNVYDGIVKNVAHMIVAGEKEDHHIMIDVEKEEKISPQQMTLFNMDDYAKR